MSSTGPSIDSRPSLTKSEIGSRPAIGEAAERPTVEERVNELYELYPEKAKQPLYAISPDDPREGYDPSKAVTLREEVTRGTNGGDTFAVTWGGAVRWFLEYCEERRERPVGRFEDAVDGEPFEVEFSPHSYHPDYLERDYARLKGLARELTSEWSNPGTALLSLTASGERFGGPVDHQLARREAWGPVYDALRYVMEKAEEEGRISDWTWVVVEEQHPGKKMGKNAGLGHDHPYILFDGELDRADFRPVISAHIDACPGAERSAHRVDHPKPEKRCVDVRAVDPDADQDGPEIRELGNYVTKYLHPEGDEHPIERPIERVMYEAVKWATNTRRLRKSDKTNRAMAADLCRQKADRVDGRPHHGERLAHDDGRGPDIVCAECGSGWGVDPEAGTIVEARRPDPPTAELVAIVVDGEEFTPSGGGVETRAVLGWNHAPPNRFGWWRGCDRQGIPPERPGDESPTPDSLGRRWEDRPPP